MQEFEIVFYKNDKGEKPVEDFLDSLNDKAFIYQNSQRKRLSDKNAIL